MKKYTIKIELQVKDATTMFALLKIIGYRGWAQEDDFTVSHSLEAERGGINLIIFESNLDGIEDVARIITGISELGLAKEEQEQEQE